MSDLFNKNPLTEQQHQDPDKHWIGETLPAPSVSEIAVGSTTVSNLGESVFPSRADHSHNIAVCQVHDASQLIIHNDSTTYISFTDEQLDPFDWHDNSVNPDRVTPNIPGWYDATSICDIITPATTIQRLYLRIAKNGGILPGSGSDITNTVGFTSQYTRAAPSPLILMNGTTDYFSVQLYMADSGGTNRAFETWLRVELKYRT